MTAILDRVGLGRAWEWLKRIPAWMRKQVVKVAHVFHGKKRRPVTEGHLDQERETEVSLGLMAAAVATPGGPSDEQRLFLASSAVGFRTRVGVLLGIPNRSLAEERELHMIERELAQIEGRDATPNAPVRIRPLLGTVGAANPLLGLAMNPMTWMVGALVASLGLNGFTTARLNHAKHDLTETRSDLRNTEAALATARTVNERLVHDIRAADLQTRETAANLEAERARHARAAAVERRRQREIQNVLTGRDPPAWSLRDDGPPAPGDDNSAPAGDSSGMPG